MRFAVRLAGEHPEPSAQKALLDLRRQHVRRRRADQQDALRGRRLVRRASLPEREHAQADAPRRAEDRVHQLAPDHRRQDAARRQHDAALVRRRPARCPVRALLPAADAEVLRVGPSVELGQHASLGLPLLHVRAPLPDAGEGAQQGLGGERARRPLRAEVLRPPHRAPGVLCLRHQEIPAAGVHHGRQQDHPDVPLPHAGHPVPRDLVQGDRQPHLQRRAAGQVLGDVLLQLRGEPEQAALGEHPRLQDRRRADDAVRHDRARKGGPEHLRVQRLLRLVPLARLPRRRRDRAGGGHGKRPLPQRDVHDARAQALREAHQELDAHAHVQVLVADPGDAVQGRDVDRVRPPPEGVHVHGELPQGQQEGLRERHEVRQALAEHLLQPDRGQVRQRQRVRRVRGQVVLRVHQRAAFARVLAADQGVRELPLVQLAALQLHRRPLLVAIGEAARTDVPRTLVPAACAQDGLRVGRLQRHLLVLHGDLIAADVLPPRNNEESQNAAL